MLSIQLRLPLCGIHGRIFVTYTISCLLGPREPSLEISLRDLRMDLMEYLVCVRDERERERERERLKVTEFTQHC